ncbi:Serine/threonine-protein phosphatase 5 [Pseudocercospora fuligena]|uniref:Serine/threonine-protein phosphatase 5 n=1 Tax=Pseudocercospora fuligena TaxID=685502 RepID=A0A8H6RKD0_9PEZI|nr:Serine/threonine-protein phosphatase 5 [Pseudocercospora fuligena]
MALSTVSAEQSVQALEKQKAVALSAHKRRGQKPTSRCTRSQLEQWYVPGRGPQPGNGSQYVMMQTVIGFAYPPSTKTLAELEPIALSQLLLETHHRGKVLIVRVFGHALRAQAAQVGIEDHNGIVERLSLYNTDPAQPPQELLPSGAVFAIKEPYYKLTTDGGTCVRVDHPSNMLRLSPTDALLPIKFRSLQSSSKPSAASLKASGNEAFMKQDWTAAAQHYSHAISACGEDDEATRHDALRNRAMANIHLKCWEQAVADANEAIVPSGDASRLNSKAYYRAGCASYHLRDYTAARASFEAARKLKANDVDTERKYKRTISRILEQQTGKYDLLRMSETGSGKIGRLDHASYSAKVEVKDSVGRGKGLFAKQKMKAGELIMVEKAYCAAFDDDEGYSMSLTLDLNTNTVATGPHAALLTQLVQHSICNPVQGAEFLSLHDSGYEPKSGALVDNGVAIDV